MEMCVWFLMATQISCQLKLRSRIGEWVLSQQASRLEKQFALHFSTEKKEEKKAASPKFWKIRQLVEAQPHVKQLLFARAWTGCDTTSAIHKKG